MEALLRKCRNNHVSKVLTLPIPVRSPYFLAYRQKITPTIFRDEVFVAGDRKKRRVCRAEIVGPAAKIAGRCMEDSAVLRRWSEIAASKSSIRRSHASAKWVLYNKGGGSRRWYGLREHMLNWEDQGAEIKASQSNTTKRSRVSNEDLFFTEGFTWSTVSPGAFGARYTPADSVFDNGGSTLF
ncbi:MAG TPA: hypothetical protein PLG99_05230, partial [Kaistiaceae bacterium]|nr:hypothetical protein [Kaistiaceae bacterium]